MATKERTEDEPTLEADLDGAQPNATEVASVLVVPVPWDGPFSISRLLKESRHFNVTRNSITVASTALWTAGPQTGTYSITLIRSVHGTIEEVSMKAYPLGILTSQTWTNLVLDEYFLQIDPHNTNPHISLKGHVWVKY